MTCEVKKILHFTAVFYEHSASKFTKELIFLQFRNCGFWHLFRLLPILLSYHSAWQRSHQCKGIIMNRVQVSNRDTG
jgi:hypothetical protein